MGARRARAAGGEGSPGPGGGETDLPSLSRSLREGRVHERTLARLLSAAMEVRKRAHAPYSKFSVGAALLGDDRKVYAGCNVENSSYGATICAERNAVVQAVAKGARGVRAIAIVADTDAPTPPCGMCLQVLAEFAAGELPILLAGVNGTRQVTSLEALLPRRFDRSYLEVPPRPATARRR